LRKARVEVLAVTTFGTALAAARLALGSAGIPTAALDARLLLADAAGLDMAALIARGGEPVTGLAEATFAAHLRRRLAGEPVARILGRKEFWGLPFLVNEATLVPRPDTEILVEAVLAQVKAGPGNISLCDLGTGSGAVIVALLSELPQATGVATDISPAALDVASENAERLGVAGRIRFCLAHFADGPDGRFDVVVSNPPYIRSGDMSGLPIEVRGFDPPVALDGGSDGLAAYRAILARVPHLLNPGGLFAVEVGYDGSQAVAKLCGEAGLEAVAAASDLKGVVRVVTGRWNGAARALPRVKKALGKVGITG
jgi:release factor glutamine methyltransferase